MKLALIILFFITISGNAQICSGTLGSPIFNETFGVGATLYGPPLTSGITNYVYQTGSPSNGSYVIANTGNPANITGYINVGDHNGNPNGYIMVVNADYGAGEAYRRHITGLCPNTTYVFSSYLANNNTTAAATGNCGSGYIYANVKFQVEYPIGVSQGFVTSGNLPTATNASAFNWGQYGFAFTTVAGQTSADVVLINNAPGGCGNDYVVDDISLAPCGPGVNLSISPNIPVFCEGQAAMLQSNFTSGNYINPQYQWQFSADNGITWNDVVGANSSNYNITAASFNNSGLYQLLISENGNINLPSCRITAGPISFSVTGLSVNSSTICAGQNTTITATGATSYTWSNGTNSNSIIISPNVSSSYTVIGVSSSCTLQAISNINVVPNSTVGVSANTTICAGETIILLANGSSTYLWDSGITTASIAVNPTITTSYSVSNTSSGLCSNIAVVTISVLPTPSISFNSNGTICQGSNSSVSLTVNGANSYAWENEPTLSTLTGSVVIASPITNTNYTVVGTSGSCSNTAVISVTINPMPSITSIFVTNTSCGLPNGSATITSTPTNNTYTWSSGAISTTNTASALPSGNYTVSAINGACQTNSVISVLSSLPLTITSTTSPTYCNLNNGSINVIDNLLNSNYVWSPNITTTNIANNLSAGIYSLNVSNGACNTSTVFTVPLISGPSSLNNLIVNPICLSKNGNINILNVISGTSPYLYNLNNIGYSSTTNFTNLSEGSYTIVVKDANNCIYTQLINLKATITNAIIDLTTNEPDCGNNNGEFIINSIHGGTAPYLTNFNNNGITSNNSFSLLSSGNYSLNIIDSNKCETQLIMKMPDNKDYSLYIPNTFTPNNDKINDIWFAQGTCLGTFNCTIYNRWGEKMKELKDINDGWDGTFNGEKVPDDVYVYIVEVLTKSGYVNRTGHITLFR